MTGWLTRSETLACTVEVEHSDEALEAHVALDGNPAIRVSCGQKIAVRRAVTLTRAGLARRAWTRFAGHFGMAELYEVSFTGRGL